MMNVAVAQLSDVGRVRTGNEDSARCKADPAGGGGRHLLVVADGMGGAAAGEVASRIAVDTMAEVFFASSDPPPEAMAKALAEANARILRASEEHEDTEGMGTTCTALCIVDSGATVAQVGDSRAYRIRAGSLTRLTSDQSVWADCVRDGGAPASEYGRNQLTNAVGIEPEMEPQLVTGVGVQAGDRFLLCSDGLWGLVADAEMLALARSGPLEDSCRHLVELANARGGHDNSTVILAEVTA